MYIARVSLNDDVVFGLVEGLDPAGDPTPQTVDALMKLDLSAGVDVEIKL